MGILEEKGADGEVDDNTTENQDKKLIAQNADFKVGDTVDCVYGKGNIKDIREDGEKISNFLHFTSLPSEF